MIPIILLISAFLVSQPVDRDGLPVEKGEIEVLGQICKYEKSGIFINVYDSRNRPIFQVTNDDTNALLLDFDYSRVLNRFVVFRLKMDPRDITYTFSLEGDNFYRAILVNVDYPVYNPVLVENDNDELMALYITDEPALVTYDVRRGREISHLTFDKPIFRLKKEKVRGRESVTFLKFDAGKSLPYYFNVKTITVPRIKKLPLSDTVHEFPEPEPKDQQISLPLIQLDEKIIVGFGDSITMGKQNGVVLPYRGYVPRLELLVNTEFYPLGDGRVINEGELAEQIIDGVSRFEKVILTYQGKYLLFHEGTNDSIWTNYSLATVYADLDYMMETALNYGVLPIISTLIPRDQNDNTGRGIYRLRAISISDYIRDLSQRLDIPMVDFWNIFTIYQEQGGFDSVMSDYVHPNDTGYQIMAEEWLKALLSLPPAMPQNVQVVYTSPFRARLQWLANIEQDFSHYILKYGYAADQLDQTDTTTDNTYDFLFYPLRGPFRSQIYVRIQAVDQDGNKSDFTPRCTVTFQ
jgi:lysophospholipase L1-like esterase